MTSTTAARLILLVLVAIGVIFLIFYGVRAALDNNDSKKPATSQQSLSERSKARETAQQKEQQQTSKPAPAATPPAASRPTSPPATPPASRPATSQPDSLANAGPGDAVAIFSVAVLAGTGLAYFVRLKHARL